VEVLNACFRDTILAPELVFLGAILGVAVGHYVSTVAAPDDEDLTHLVMREVFLVPFHILVARFKDHVAVLAVIDCLEDCPVPFVYPVLSHRSAGAPLMENRSVVLVFAVLI
jgi:hypothetical protein